VNGDLSTAKASEITLRVALSGPVTFAFPQHIYSLWRFCVGAQDAGQPLSAVFGPGSGEISSVAKLEQALEELEASQEEPSWRSPHEQPPNHQARPARAPPGAARVTVRHLLTPLTQLV
jgi:hypothetical protein